MKGAWIDGRNVKSNYCGLLPIKHLLPQIWKLGLQNKEKSNTLNEFENTDIQIGLRVDFVNSI